MLAQVSLSIGFVCTSLAAAQTQLRAWHGTATGDALGSGIADVGDVDGDGIHDFALGVPGDDFQIADGGKVIVVAGSDGHEIRTLTGGHYDRRFGSSITAIPDLDGDGVIDVLIQSRGYVSNTYRYVAVSVASGSSLWSYAFTNVSSYLGPDAVIPTAAPVGDIDADGRTDVAIGVPSADYNGTQSRVVVLSGSTGSVLHSISQPAPQSYLGMGVCAAGDIDNDGHADWWMTRNWNYFYTFVQARSGIDGHLIYEIGLPYVYESDIVVRAAVGDDLDADGVPELVVAVPVAPIAGIQGPGRISAYSGATGALLWSRTGSNPTQRIGWWLKHVGDIDRDGVRDLATAVGYPTPYGYGAYALSNLRLGILSGKTGAMLRHLDAPAGMGSFAEITGGGDVDGDGQNDVLYSAMTTSYSPTLGQYVYSSGLAAAASLVHVSLAGSCFELDNAAGGQQTLSVDFGPQFAYRGYRILGSLSGMQPGLATPAGILPIAVDGYFWSTRSAGGDSHLGGAFGMLDAQGRATATFTLQAGSTRFPSGTSVLHAAMALDAAGTSVAATSRAVPLLVR